jgi:hypothetical protein
MLRLVFFFLPLFIAMPLQAESNQDHGAPPPASIPASPPRPEAAPAKDAGMAFIEANLPKDSDDMVRKDGSLLKLPPSNRCQEEARKAYSKLAREYGYEESAMTPDQQSKVWKDLVMDKKTPADVLKGVYLELLVAKLFLSASTVKTEPPLTEAQRLERLAQVQSLSKAVCTRLDVADGYWQITFSEKQANEFAESIGKAVGEGIAEALSGKGKSTPPDEKEKR